MNPRGRKMLMFSPLILLAFAAFLALGGVVVRELWNALLPPLFGWKAVTFWQALGLLALCRILFGGFPPGGGPPRSRLRDRMTGRREAMRSAEREGLHGKGPAGPGAP